MNKTHSILIIIILLTTLSCRNKEICPDCFLESVIEVKFDMSNIKDMPKGFRVNFYNQDGILVYTFNLASTGGTVRINAGDYKVFCFNNDSEYIMYKNQDNLSKLTFYTRQLQSNKEAVFKNPDKLCTAFLKNQVIKPYFTGSQVITLTLKSNIANYTYQIGKIINGNYITGIKTTLSGLRSQYIPMQQDGKMPTASMPFNDIEFKDAMLIGNMKNYGINPGETENILTQTIYHRGGPPIIDQIDVTDQIKNAPDPENVHIIINKTIDIPTTIISGGEDGVNPSIEDWEKVEEIVYL